MVFFSCVFFFFHGKQTERKILGGLGFSTGTNRKGVRRFDRSWTWWGRFSFWCTRHLSLLLSSSSSNQRTQNHNRWFRWPKLESTTILSNPNWQKQFFFFFFLIKRERASAREREREWGVFGLWRGLIYSIWILLQKKKRKRREEGSDSYLFRTDLRVLARAKLTTSLLLLLLHHSSLLFQLQLVLTILIRILLIQIGLT